MKVLLIEDNPADVRLIQEAFSELGQSAPELEAAASLSQGVERIAQGGIDVVLLDLSLPDSHGIDTLYQAQSHAQGVPVVVLTGLDEYPLALKAVSHGAQDYLVKSQATAKELWRSCCYAVERSRTFARWEESHRLVQRLNSLIYVYQAATGWVVYGNQRFGNALGLDAAALGRDQGLAPEDFMHAEDLDGLRDRMRLFRKATDDQLVECDFRMKSREGNWICLRSRECVHVRDRSGLPELIVGSAQVVAEEQRAEEQLTREHELLSAVLDSLTEAIFVKDRQGRYLCANSTQVRLLGAKSRAEVVGKTDADFVPGGMARHCVEFEREVLEGQRLQPEREEVWQIPGGKECSVAITRAPLRDEQGNLRGVLGISRQLGFIEAANGGASRAETARQAMQRAATLPEGPELEVDRRRSQRMHDAVAKLLPRLKNVQIH